MENAPQYGTIFQEASILEERCGEYHRSIEIAERGLEENPRYGPLYLTVLRLYEKVANGDLTNTREVVERAIKFIPKELRWKIYYEAAHIEEHAGNWDRSRQQYVQSVKHCPSNLIWKVWLAGARTELRANPNNPSVARKLIQRSLRDVPHKKKAQAWLEWAHLEEFCCNIEQSREVLNQAKKEASHEWKVFLESILLEMRARNIDQAMREAKEALQAHTGTGRLWALLIQLKEVQGQQEQLRIFEEALHEVPKSGEVWCEGARIFLARKDWEVARKFLEFAIHFTPQFGDSFIEYLRLELLENKEKADLAKLRQLCTNAEPNYGTLWMYCKQQPVFSTNQVLDVAKKLLQNPVGQSKSILSLESNTQGFNLDMTQFTQEERWRLIFGCDDLKP